MNGIRAKITPSLTDQGLIHLLIEWVEVVDDRPGQVLKSEEFQVSPARAGTAYISRAVFQGGDFLPGTFCVDENGLRHFNMDLEAGVVGLTGQFLGVREEQT